MLNVMEVLETVRRNAGSVFPVTGNGHGNTQNEYPDRKCGGKTG